MIIKKRLYLPLCKYLRPRALFCAFMLITSLKRTALMIDTLFFNIPFSVPVHPLKKTYCNDLFPKYIKMYSH